MWLSSHRVQICWLYLACHGWAFSAALGVGLRTVTYPNSTSTSTRLSSSFQSSSILEGSLVTPTTTVISSSSTENFTGTITSAPVYPWGNQSIQLNTCSVTATGGDIQWTPCEIFAGTVQMSYFPESQGNLSYPATYYDPGFGVTMTSPSVYMMVNTLTGDNPCGPLGPTFMNEVVSMDLTEVFTLQPYADHTVTTRMGPPLPLTLGDLISNCLNTYSTFSTDGAFVNTHPVYGNYNRCHPRFVFPIQFKRVGYPYWMHCGSEDYNFGVFDPPGAVPPVVGLLPTTVAAPITTTSDPASPLPTAASDQAASTTTAEAQPTNPAPSAASDPAASTTNAGAQIIPPVASSPSPADPPLATTVSQADPTTPIETSSNADPASTPSGAGPSIPANSAISASTPQSDLPVTTPSFLIPTSATAILTVGTQTLSAIPGSTGIVLPNGSTVKPGGVATVTDANSRPVVVSVGTSGVFVAGPSSGESTTYYANPTIPPVVIATIGGKGGEVVSAVPGAENVVVGSQTASLGGVPITVAGSVIKLTPSGVIVNDASGGSAVTFAIPIVAAAPTAFATVGGQVISAAPGDSSVVLNGQVVTAGGAPVTLTGSNNVASLGPGVLVIQYPGGSLSSFALPAATSAAVILGKVAGLSISASVGASVISIGNQAITLNGAPITVSNEVVSLGPSGLEIQMPDGAVTTLSPQARESTATGVVTSGGGIASMIASSMSLSSLKSTENGAYSQAVVAGASQTGTSTVTGAGTTGLSSSRPSGLHPPAAVSTSGGPAEKTQGVFATLIAVFLVWLVVYGI